jgi:hypothetical protein
MSRFVREFRVLGIGRRMACADREIPEADGAPVFTDDLAPIEEMTRRMLAER